MTQTDTSIRRLAEDIAKKVCGVHLKASCICPTCAKEIESALTTLTAQYEERIKALEQTHDELKARQRESVNLTDRSVRG